MAKSANGEKARATVRSRLVLNFPGFEATGPLAQLDRLRHSAEKTGEIWSFAYERLSEDVATSSDHAVSEHLSRGENWETRTRLVQFSWSDVIESYEKVSFPLGLFRNFPKFLAFFFDGTVARYYRTSTRYWAFTIFPLLLIALFAVVAWPLCSHVAGWLAPGGPRLFLTLVLTAIAVILLCRWPGEKAYLLLTINDWGFARDMVNRVNPEIEHRYFSFAETLEEEIGASRHDEIVICGHSFGSVWAVAALALALERRPGLLKGRNVTFLALGSSLLKIALAPHARFMRDWTARIVAEPDLLWHEIQTKDDIIAFYKADPFAALAISAPAATVKIDRVRYKDAMDGRRYKKMRTSFYRTHRQYILYQDRRVAFDYILRLFGPLSSRDLALRPEIAALIDPRGRLA